MGKGQMIISGRAIKASCSSLEDAASQYAQNLNLLDKAVDEVRANYTGQGGNSFVKRYEEVVPMYREILKTLNESHDYYTEKGVEFDKLISQLVGMY